MGLQTVVGRVKLSVWQGQDPRDKHWGCPIRERWGLGPHQQMSPALEEKLAFTATLYLLLFASIVFWLSVRKMNQKVA